MKYQLKIKKDGVSIFPYAKEFLSNLKGIIYQGKVDENYSHFEFKGKHLPYSKLYFDSDAILNKIIITPIGEIYAIVFEIKNNEIIYEKKVDIGRFSLTEDKIEFNFKIILNHLEESVDWPNNGIDSLDAVINYLKDEYVVYYKTLYLLVISITKVIQYIFDREFDVIINTYENFDVANPHYMGINHSSDVSKIVNELNVLFEKTFEIKQ